MSSVRSTVDFSRSGPYFFGLFAVALVAFWPTYLSLKPAASSVYTHFHAYTATIWMLMLIVQPWLIRKRRLPMHRLIGRAAWVVGPLVVVSMILLSNNRIRIAGPESYAIQTYILYLQLSLIVLFGLAFGLAMYYLRVTALHARFMVCTALTLIDPILIRIMFWISPQPAWNYQWLTFGLTDLALVVLIWIERNGSVARSVFPRMLALFIALQIPALFGWTEGAMWQSFARWFAGVPLT